MATDYNLESLKNPYNRICVNLISDNINQSGRYMVSSRDLLNMVANKASDQQIADYFKTLILSGRARKLVDGAQLDKNRQIPLINLDISSKNSNSKNEKEEPQILGVPSEDGEQRFVEYGNGSPESPLVSKNVQSSQMNMADEVQSQDSTPSNAEVLQRYTPQQLDLEIKGLSIKPCFDVMSLANAFVSLINSIATSRNDNIAMLGIFAPWGRGKTYFWNQVKGLIDKSNSKKFNRKVSYKIAEFNAWKYQDEPAIWAYLFEIVYKRMSFFGRFTYSVYRHLFSILRDFVIFSIPAIITFLLNGDTPWKVAVISVSTCGFILHYILEHYDSAISLIKKCTRGISFSEHLGVQAEIEKELSILLKFWLPNVLKANKLVLYVDDIDRCDHEKMLSVVESLRTIIENKDIKDRLIVICSVDPSKLAAALTLKYKKLNLSDKEISNMVYDQFDKLFVSSISLPELKFENEVEYLAKLAGSDVASLSSVFQSQSENVYESKMNFGYGAPSDNKSSEDDGISEIKVAEIMATHILSHEYVLTPRKLSHLYYRCLFGILLHKEIYGMQVFEKRMIEDIIDYSLVKIVELSSDDIIKIVTPYPTALIQ